MGTVIGPFDQQDFNNMREIKDDIQWMRSHPELGYEDDAINLHKKLLKRIITRVAA